MALGRTTEIKLEEFLSENPYLIENSFKNITPVRQEKNGRYRTDLTFRLNGLLTIVEIKKTILGDEALAQILNYISLFKEKEELSEIHFLVGKMGKHPESFRDKARMHNIKVLYLGIDIPQSLLYDSHRRIYIPFDAKLAGKSRYLRSYILQL